MATPRRETWGFRLAPSKWPRIFREIRERPGDVVLGAELFFSVGGHDEGPSHRRFLRNGEGRRLVEERTPYPALFTDLDGLRALPDGTLGREYVRQLDERGIDPIELARLTDEAYVGQDFTPVHTYVRRRVRDAHDLYHTLTGYGIDVLGEAGALAFTFGQTGNKGWAVLVFLNHLTALSKLRFAGIGISWRAFWRGRRARFVPGLQEWDRLLRVPLCEVRAELGIVPAEPYAPLWLEDVFEVLAESRG